MSSSPEPSFLRIFALLIGIDNYAHETIQSLKGAVADAQSVKKLLHEKFGTPNDRIILLKDSSAKSADITNALKSLAVNPDIQACDPIIIFFAGHGTRLCVPEQWSAGSRCIQALLPYDAFVGADPIADRTFGNLVEDIASAKENNIVSRCL